MNKQQRLPVFRQREIQNCIMRNNIALLIADNDRASTEICFADGTNETIALPAETVLENWCLSYGSTLKGRIEAAALLTGCRTKLPVLIREEDTLLLFPMRSLKADGFNCWISDNLLAAAIPHERTETTLVFINGYQAKIPYDIRMVRRQQEVCRKYRDILAKRKMEY